jgi:hypothetical protein
MRFIFLNLHESNSYYVPDIFKENQKLNIFYLMGKDWYEKSNCELIKTLFQKKQNLKRKKSIKSFSSLSDQDFKKLILSAHHHSHSLIKLCDILDGSQCKLRCFHEELNKDKKLISQFSLPDNPWENYICSEIFHGTCIMICLCLL